MPPHADQERPLVLEAFSPEPVAVAAGFFVSGSRWPVSPPAASGIGVYAANEQRGSALSRQFLRCHARGPAVRLSSASLRGAAPTAPQGLTGMALAVAASPSGGIPHASSIVRKIE